MPKTRDERLTALAEARAWLDGIERDPDILEQDWSHADLRRILDVRSAMEKLQEELDVVVAAARANGRPWQVIAIPLGISRQAANEQYG